MTRFERIVRASARRPARVLVIVAVLAVVGCALALRLEPSAATDTLVGRGADTYQATERYRERFGDHSVIVLARGELSNLLLTSNLGKLIGLEGCLSGNKPEDQEAPGGAGSPCGRLAALKPVQVVYGPGTFANASAGEINDQIQAQLRAKAAEADNAARAARKVAQGQGRSKAEQDRFAESARQLVYAQFVRDLLQINLKYGLGTNGLPSVDDPNFVAALFFDPSRGATTPKARFAYLVPSSRAALIQVRLKPTLTDAQRAEAVELVRAAVRMPDWKLKGDAGYTVTGAPVVAEDLTDALAGSTLRLLLIGLAVMALVLCLVFRSRLRLVPLAVALAAVAITFGAMALVGAPLTMASIAVLPVLLGLGVDYAIQYQARVQEAGDPARAARTAVPAIGTAALATGAGFLVLLLSPVPMVRQFGALLVVGIAIAFALALTAGTAALSIRPREHALARSLRGAGELVEAASGWLGRADPSTRPGRGRGGRRRRAPPGPRAGRRPRRCGGRMGGWTRAPRSCPTSSGSSRRICRPSRTSRRSRSPPAWPARSTWWWKAPTSPSPPWCAGCATTSRACWGATATRPSAAAATRSCARRSRCPTCSAPRRRRATASASGRCSTRCRRTSPAR